MNGGNEWRMNSLICIIATLYSFLDPFFQLKKKLTSFLPCTIFLFKKASTLHFMEAAWEGSAFYSSQGLFPIGTIQYKIRYIDLAFLFFVSFSAVNWYLFSR